MGTKDAIVQILLIIIPIALLSLLNYANRRRVQ